MQVHVARDGKQVGVFSLEEIKQQLAAGTLTLSDQAWYEGAAGWAPLEKYSDDCRDPDGVRSLDAADQHGRARERADHRPNPWIVFRASFPSRVMNAGPRKLQV